jgi:hypothetical protein
MKIHLYILLLIPCVLFSQDLKKIKVADTIYIYFKNDNVNQIKSLNNSKLKSFNYIFVFDLKDIKTRQSFDLFDDYRTTIPETKLVRKSFLKKNKNIIVDYDLLRKLGFFEAQRLLLNKKKLYLIDYDNIQCFKVKIIEVKIISRDYLTPIE